MSMPDEVEETTATGRKLDPELRTMGAMLRLLEDLDEDARPRVVNWLTSRFKSVSFAKEE